MWVKSFFAEPKGRLFLEMARARNKGPIGTCYTGPKLTWVKKRNKKRYVVRKEGKKERWKDRENERINEGMKNEQPEWSDEHKKSLVEQEKEMAVSRLG